MTDEGYSRVTIAYLQDVNVEEMLTRLLLPGTRPKCRLDEGWIAAERPMVGDRDLS